MSDITSHAGERPFVLVLGLDLADQESSGYAFDEAVRIASRIAGSELHVLHVVSAQTHADTSREMTGLLRLYVADKAKALDVQAPRRVGIHVRSGDPAREIAQLAVDVAADMIVVGARRQLRSILVGTTADRVMQATSCPVFVAGPRPRPQPSHVIVIEPPCPDCVQARIASNGRSWWCARHSEHHHLRRHHLYSYHSDLPFADHDSEVTATGTDAR